MTADDHPVLTSHEHRLDEAELAQAALEGVELVVADPPGVRRVGSEVVDQDLLDDEGGGQRCVRHADLARAAASHSSRPSIGTR